MENCSRLLLMSSFHWVQSLFSSGDITFFYLLLILPNFLQEFQNKDTQHNVHSFRAIGKVCNADYFIGDEGMSFFYNCSIVIILLQVYPAKWLCVRLTKSLMGWTTRPAMMGSSEYPLRKLIRIFWTKWQGSRSLLVVPSSQGGKELDQKLV